METSARETRLPAPILPFSLWREVHGDPGKCGFLSKSKSSRQNFALQRKKHRITYESCKTQSVSSKTTSGGSNIHAISERLSRPEPGRGNNRSNAWNWENTWVWLDKVSGKGRVELARNKRTNRQIMRPCSLCKAGWTYFESNGVPTKVSRRTIPSKF